MMQLVIKPETDSKKRAAKSARGGLYVAARGGRRAAGASKDDGTRQLLQSGAGTILAGVVALLLMLTVCGGVTHQGPHTSSGWLALIVALMCVPFGSLLFLLGVAKWFRNRRTEQDPHARKGTD